MPRKKQFDVDASLDKAMKAFWARGYAATSLRDLLACMQIKRPSLYNAFGDKHTLFLTVLRRYAVIRQAKAVTLATTFPPREAIIRLFQKTATPARDDRPLNGCFLTHTALEVAPHDDEVAAVVQEAFARIEHAFFRTLIEKGRASGEIAQSVKPAETARALLSLFIGLEVLARSRPEKLLLQSVARQAKALLPRGK